jgi:hypothetical protein
MLASIEARAFAGPPLLLYATSVSTGLLCCRLSAETRFDAAAFAAGGKACKPRILGIGVDSGHHEHRNPSTRVATDARGWRSTFRRSADGGST